MRVSPSGPGEEGPEEAPLSLVFHARDGVGGRWGSRQHLAQRLSRRHPLVYVEEAVRVPGIPLHRREAGPGGLATLTPAEWPFQRFGAVRRMAARSIANAIRGTLAAGSRDLAVVAYPRARLDVVRALRPSAVVFHAVDDYSEYADRSPDVRYLAWERGMRDLAEATMAVSRPLAERLAREGFRDVRYVPLGFDEGLRNLSPAPPPPGWEAGPGPVLGFVGTVRAERLDTRSVRAVAAAFPGARLVFVGEEFDDPGGSLADLRRLRNVEFLGHRTAGEAAAFTACLDVAIVPYAPTRLNLRCFPLKVVDALALGRPVVLSPPRPDIEEFRGVVRFASDPESFVREVREALEEADDPSRCEARRNAVAGLGWDLLAERMEGIILEVLRGGRPQPM